MLIALFFTTTIVLIAVFLYLARALLSKQNADKQLEVIESQKEQNKIALIRKVYHAEVLRELSERIGYSLDIPKIIEVITGSLGEVLDYNTASYMIIEDNHILFHSFISKSVNHQFIKDVKKQMLKAFSTMLNSDISGKYVAETISGTVLDDTLEISVESFFNLPLVIEGKVAGVINISSPKKGLYTEDETKILYTITRQAADHFSKLKKLLQEEKRRLNAMVSSMADGVIMLDKDIQPIVFNPAAQKMLGLESVKNPTILDIANSLSGKIDLRNKLDEALKMDKIVEQKDIFLENKALHLLISPVKDSKGELLGSAVLFRDVTAQKELEQMRDEFTAMMVHELRAPLTTIKGTTDMIINEKRISPEAKNKLLATMKQDSEHMLDLVGELLDVAKIEAGKFQIEPAENNLAQTIKEVALKFAPQAQQKGLQMQVNLDKNIHLISFDKLRIGQVLNNLLSNAIKYTDKGLIRISLVKKPEFLVVSVTDSGAGMSPQEVAGLFSKFKQFGKGKSGKIKGTGLGLVIAKGIIETHGGKIWAESQGREKGSTFSFSLPIIQKTEQKDEAVSNTENTKNKGGEKEA
jgi:PAS domain S-box-containing protein